MTSGVEAVTEDTVHDQIMARCAEIQSWGGTSPKLARDPINQPMINNWVEAMGDANPRYVSGEAPPAMAQVWTMGGLNPQRDPRDPLHQMMETLTALGFTGVLGTNCEQRYDRYLQVGEHVTVTTTLESVVGPKQTGVGTGYFVTSRNVWRVGDEQVATMLFRVLKFIPGTAPKKAPAIDPTQVIRPMRNRDTEFFWEGTEAGEIRIQKCTACNILRHPPGPSCPDCGSYDWSYDVASGTGTLFSYVVHRHPPVPGRELPIVIALVDLPEGTRLLGELKGVEPDDVTIGMSVTADFQRIDDDLTLPIWRAS